MLEITPSTYSTFAFMQEEAFVAEVVMFLRQNVMSLAQEREPDITQQVRALIKDARGHGLTSEQSVCTYCLTAAQLGLDFPMRFRGAGEILCAPDPEHEKAARIKAFTLNLLKTLTGP